MPRAPRISRVNLTTSLPFKVREDLAKFAKAKNMPMATVIEEGIKIRMAGAAVPGIALPDDVESDLREYMAEMQCDRATVLELALRRFFKAEENG
jgi:hypothetical protein